MADTTTFATCMLLATTMLTAQGGWSARSTFGPLPRAAHAMTFDAARGVTVMFGGSRGATLFDDTWTFDGTAWSVVLPPILPPARRGHGLAYDLTNANCVLFGGNAGADLSDTWTFDGSVWTRQTPVHSPGTRREFGFAFDPATAGVLLFGGVAGPFFGTIFGDTWRWNGVDWTQLAPTASPLARFGQSMSHDMIRSRVVMFGGHSGTNQLYETWSWNGTMWTRLTSLRPGPSEATGIGLACDDTNRAVVMLAPTTTGTAAWVLDGSDWHIDTRGPTPPARTGYAVAGDLLRQRIVVFGGIQVPSNVELGDTWDYATTPAASVANFGVGCTAGVIPPLLTGDSTRYPLLGTTYTLTLLAVRPTGLSAITLGLSDTQWVGGALPASLAALGMPGCTLFVRPDTTTIMPLSGGRATLGLQIPNSPGLVGARCFAQAFVMEPTANATGAVVSNACAMRIGAY